jgi:Fe-S-cluster containining protein
MFWSLDPTEGRITIVTLPPVRVLSLHAQYRCRHAGACCTSNWPIPIEADRLLSIRAALAAGRLRPAVGDRESAVDAAPDAPAETPAILGREDHQCVFYDRSPAAAAGRCRIQSALGHEGLPLACRQFPRVSVHDPRGVSVTLSHYCPTAAGLLDAEPAPDDEFTIVVNPDGFPATGEYVGLDARTALPPLLRRNMLMDWASWWACERLAVEIIGRAEHPAAALHRLRVAATDIARWSPADGELIDRVPEAFVRAERVPALGGAPDGARLVEAAIEAIPADLRPDRLPSGPRPTHAATLRFLAAHAFASWAIHREGGLGDWLRSVETAAAMIEAGAGVRQADLLLRHLA